MSNDPAKVLRDYLDFDMKELSEEESVFLPLYHSCTEDELISFLRSEMIEASEPCDVLKRNVVYTFYGAAKFIKADTRRVASDGDLTACIVLDPRACGNIDSIFPIDTGVWSGQTPGHREALDWESIVRKLNLGDRIDRINKMALMCFVDLEKYVDGKVSTRVIDEKVEVVGKYPPPDLISHVKDMHKLMLDQSLADNRRFCCEVLFLEKMSLAPSNVLQIMAFSGMLEKDAFHVLMKRYRVTVDESYFYFYPSSEASKYETGKLIKDLSIQFTKEMFINGRKEV